MRNARLAMLLAGALIVGTAGAAYASSQFTQTSNITLTATKAGKPTGLKAALNAADPGAVQPQGLKTLTITLPANTKFNFKSAAIKQCKAGDTEIKATGGAVCPAKSKIGSGEALANGAPVIPAIPEVATAYAGNGQIIFLLAPKGPAGQVLVLHGKVSKNVVTTQVPVDQRRRAEHRHHRAEPDRENGREREERVHHSRELHQREVPREVAVRLPDRSLHDHRELLEVRRVR